MKRVHVILIAACLLPAIGTVSRAQMGMNFFKKPAIADIFKPVVGNGAVYETEQNQQKSTIEMSIVGQEAVDGKDAFWLEFGHTDPRSGMVMYGKMLVTKDDFQFHRMIVQRPGQPPMEFPASVMANAPSHVTRNWRSGTKSGLTLSLSRPAFSSAITGPKTTEKATCGSARKFLHEYGERNHANELDGSRQTDFRCQGPHHRNAHQIRSRSHETPDAAAKPTVRQQHWIRNFDDAGPRERENC